MYAASIGQEHDLSFLTFAAALRFDQRKWALQNGVMFSGVRTLRIVRSIVKHVQQCEREGNDNAASAPFHPLIADRSRERIMPKFDI